MDYIDILRTINTISNASMLVVTLCILVIVIGIRNDMLDRDSKDQNPLIPERPILDLFEEEDD